MENAVHLHSGHGFEAEAKKNFFATYKPLLIVGSFILLVTALVEVKAGSFSTMRSMRDFMAGFFLFFSFFKFLNLSAFADAFQMYDVIGKKFRGYALAYPFIELALGIVILLEVSPEIVNVVTAVFMVLGNIGVWQSLRKRQTIQCACLGTIFDLPMTKVTLFENSLMLAMALLSLFKL